MTTHATLKQFLTVLNLKGYKKTKTEEPQEGDEVKYKRKNIEQMKTNIKICKFLNDSTGVCGKKWIEVNDLSGGQYSVSKNLRFKTPILRSNFCDYSDADIVVKRRITVADTVDAKERHKKLVFKNKY